MDSLKNKEGAEFDKAYLAEMIKHHTSGIEMMNMAIEKAENEEICDMSEKMAKTQAEEMKKMEAMLESL